MPKGSGRKRTRRIDTKRARHAWTQEKKTVESGEKNPQYQRVGSKGKGLMPKIQVVSQPPPVQTSPKGNKSPLHDIVIDLEETVNPLGFSQRSDRKSMAVKQKNKIEEEISDPGQDSDDGVPIINVKPIDSPCKRN